MRVDVRRGAPVRAAGGLAADNAGFLERIYREWNRMEHLHPDPLEFVYEYTAPADREMAALVAATLAYGRVGQILESVRDALCRLGASPAAFVARHDPGGLRGALAGFRHRFTSGEELAGLLEGAGELVRRCGSLERAFTARLRPEHETTVPALCAFVEDLREASGASGHVLPDPAKGSACKRLHLFLRWMVRNDEVDPGVWTSVRRSMLVVPLDVHMHRIARRLGATGRPQADLRAALETTAWFRQLAPEDPVKYDFALTRLGMRGIPAFPSGRRQTC